ETARNVGTDMKTLEATELQANIDEILREVEGGQIVEVTRNGKVVARFVPANHRQSVDRDANSTWSELLRLRDEISAIWPEGVSAQDAINDVRREL
ncbi:MAG: type II toxin-antitoxin system prevent-host-death family antitoxin, partial [Chloroflexia bacterium]